MNLELANFDSTFFISLRGPIGKNVSTVEHVTVSGRIFHQTCDH